MERGLRIPQSDRTKTTNALLVSLMNQLEKNKKSLKLGPDDQLHLEGFALNVFAKADKQDQAGRADLNTAKTFYAASIFFEILNQFGALQPDLEQKQKYAARKAEDISKALKEGRKPVPVPPDGESDISKSSTTQSDELDVEPRADLATKSAPESDPSIQLHDKVERMHSSNIPPGSLSQVSPSPPYSAAGYPSHDYHPPPPISRHESSPYSQPFHEQPSPQEYQSPLPTNYPSQDIPYSYPNFQSYPSFTESSLPAAPTHCSSQGSDASYSTMSPSSTTNYLSTSQYNSSDRSGSAAQAEKPHAKTYQFDSIYQPPQEKVAEAHKAARFAVGALSFGDAVVAVDFLKQSLELLTNPSAGQ